MTSRAVFFDRDNTLIEDPGFIDDSEKVVLRPGAAEAVRRVRSAGYKVLVVSNQSGVARGLITDAQLESVNQRLRDLLAREGAAVDAVYCCPFLEGPEAKIKKYRKDSDLRKPRPGMLLKAAKEHKLDLARSWMIGDRISDIEAGAAAGCRTIRVGLETPGENGAVRPTHSALTLLEAASIVESDRAEPRPSAASESRENVRNVLTEIRDAVTRLQRRDSQEDFSVSRLMASLTQMLALVAAIWAVMALFNDNPIAAIARFALAGFLQLLTLTVFLASKRS